MRYLLGTVFSAIALRAFAAQISVTCPWARATLPHQDDAASYLTLKSAAADTLTGADAKEAGIVMMHETKSVSGREEMGDLDQVSVPANTPVSFSPGHMHLMLMGMEAPLRAGSTLHLTLHFAKAGDVTVAAPILALGAAAPCP